MTLHTKRLLISGAFAGIVLSIAISIHFILDAITPTNVQAFDKHTFPSPDGKVHAISYWKGRGSGSYFVAIMPSTQSLNPNSDADDVFQVVALNLEPGQKDIFEVKWTDNNHLVIHIGSGSVFMEEKEVTVLGKLVKIKTIVDKRA